ncbi:MULTISPECIES: SpoIIE family protein phosphatase [unclassified Streptomyces]|uniref:PP2C family protein-serine/threonine phosphatase n=1 Tax=unclassified Streptomyces TaxID=2593676 RepID=UPI002DDA3147|nr:MULTISPECIES: SpoIIE family protein phosphatase [unclassified Streptomyces]WSB80937.1 SpoIIE family protein phosphatase [Streptomyces sp. NBC_01775]WSS10853.1 SpoIIE family protein phosphatase [Streptomyces sp. NBC_01186]WSS39550.1 SpoIIE family protein phosphatase [Streptomyces sp. NBC_01187]
MSSHFHADRPAAQPPERGALDALITQTRRLRGGVDAVRRGAGGEADEGPPGAADLRLRWQRALCELAVHQLDDLGSHLDQLREGLPAESLQGLDGPPLAPPTPEAEHLGPDLYGEPLGPVQEGPLGAAYGAVPTPRAGTPTTSPLVGRVGSADWNLLNDEVTWSEELYAIFGRTREDGPLSLDELPSWVMPEDQPALAAAFTDCLVDGRAIDREFRLVRPDGSVRTLHMVGEPVLDDDGGTASMWAVLRDVSELRRSERAVSETRDSLQRERQIAQTERRVAVELQEAVLPPWRGSLRFPHGDGEAVGALDLAAHYLPSATGALIGGDWYDAMELPDGSMLLTAGDLTGHGVTATSGMAMLLGAVRGMAVAGVEPGALMGYLNQLLDSAAQPALGSAVCCRYEPRARSLTWSQAGHPAPLLFRDGAGQVLNRPEGVLLGVTSGATYGQRTERLEPGDLLVLHTDGLAPRSAQLSPQPDGEEPRTGAERLLGLAPRFASARTAQECVRAVAEEFGDREREDDACVLVARITP